MQSFVMRNFPDIVKARAKKYPGGLSGVARKIGISQQSLYNKLNGDTEFKLSELARLDRLLDFTPEEKAVIWR